ncbi:unnamed protein product, partial [Iphiclides podalirius]
MVYGINMATPVRPPSHPAPQPRHPCKRRLTHRPGAALSSRPSAQRPACIQRLFPSTRRPRNIEMGVISRNTFREPGGYA